MNNVYEWYSSHIPFRDSLADPFPFASIFKQQFIVILLLAAFILLPWKFCRPRRKKKGKSVEREKIVEQWVAQTLCKFRLYRTVGGGCSGLIPLFPNWIKPISRNNVQSPVCNLFITQIQPLPPPLPLETKGHDCLDELGVSRRSVVYLSTSSSLCV